MAVRRAGDTAQWVEHLCSSGEARAWVLPLHQQDGILGACDSSTQEVEAGNSEVQAHLQRHGECEASLTKKAKEILTIFSVESLHLGDLHKLSLQKWQTHQEWAKETLLPHGHWGTQSEDGSFILEMNLHTLSDTNPCFEMFPSWRRACVPCAQQA